MSTQKFLDFVVFYLKCASTKIAKFSYCFRAELVGKLNDRSVSSGGDSESNGGFGSEDQSDSDDASTVKSVVVRKNPPHHTGPHPETRNGHQKSAQDQERKSPSPPSSKDNGGFHQNGDDSIDEVRLLLCQTFLVVPYSFASFVCAGVHCTI